jgi:hypothetical protein
MFLTATEGFHRGACDVLLTVWKGVGMHAYACDWH